MKKQRVTWLLFGMLVCILSSCMKDFLEESSYYTADGGVSWIKSGDVAAITANTVTVQGAVDMEEMKVLGTSEQILDFGIVYSAEQFGDLVSGGTMVSAGEGASTSGYSIELRELMGSTTYFYAAYVKTESSTYLGKTKNFVTLPLELPEPSIPTVVSRSVNSILVSSSIESENMDQNYEKGFCWRAVSSQYKEPTLNDCEDSRFMDWSSPFEAEIEINSSDAVYAIRAFVRSYETSEVVYSETLYAGLQEGAFISPVILTDNGNGVAVFQAMLLNFGNVVISERGFCFSNTTSSPEIDTDEKIVDNSSEETMLVKVAADGFDPELFYYVRAYCVVDGMVFYGPTYIYGKREVGIYTVEDLIAFRDAHNSGGDVSMWKNENNEIKLYMDIDMSSVVDWTPINELWYDEIFDGNGYHLTNFKIGTYKTDCSNYGLIGTNSGIIKNLHIGDGSSIDFEVPENTSSVYAGSICAFNNNTVSGCTSSATIDISSVTNSNTLYVGGIVGENSAEIEKCEFAGSLNAQSLNAYLGGIVAYMAYESKISGCVNRGTVGLGYQYKAIGGIVGCGSKSDILSCVNEGTVKGNDDTEYVGGIAGYCEGGSSNGYSVINMCSNSAEVKGGKSYTGGIVGWMQGSITECVNTQSGVITTKATSAGAICGYLNNSINNFVNNQNQGTVNGETGNLIGTDQRPPLVGKPTVMSQTSTSVVLMAEIIDHGGGNVIKAGFYYSTRADYYGDSVVGSIEGNIISVTLENLTPGTTYFVRTYAQNNNNTSTSGEYVSFTTAPLE